MIDLQPKYQLSSSNDSETVGILMFQHIPKSFGTFPKVPKLVYFQPVLEVADFSWAEESVTLALSE